MKYRCVVVCPAGKRDPSQPDNVCSGAADRRHRRPSRRHLHHPEYQDGTVSSTHIHPTPARRRAEDSAILRAARHRRT